MKRKRNVDFDSVLGTAGNPLAAEAVDIASDEALFERWRSDFGALSSEEQQDLLYHLLNDRLYWRIVYYLRRFPGRLTSSQTTYSDRCIGGEELMV